MTHYEVLQGNGNAVSFTHFIDDLAAARDRLELPNDAILIIDNVPFHHSLIVVEMLELRGFEYKYLPPYSPYFNGIECVFSEWKHFVKEGLHNELAPNEQALKNRMNEFNLSAEHARNYFQHVANNCIAYMGGQRVFDN
jgi:hypothetical protein